MNTIQPHRTTDSITIAFDREQLEEIRQIAREQQRTISFIVREAVRKGLNKGLSP